MPGAALLSDCKDACAAVVACEGFLFRAPNCYRKKNLQLDRCDRMPGLDLYVKLLPPSPPSPPAPLTPPFQPPEPPSPPFGSSAFALNARFRDARPSNKLQEAGIVMHQFDGLELVDRPWEFCEGPSCRCQGQMVPGRVSAMIIHQRLRDRGDRAAIPLPFDDRGGVLLRPTAVSLECMYGIDGGTFRWQSVDHPGCSDDFCDAASMSLAPTGDSSESRWLACGFMGSTATAWHPADLKLLLQMHMERGASYKWPGWHAGYNEVILSSEKVNAALPGSIEAFFVMEGQAVFSLNDPFAHTVDMRVAHREFLRLTGLSADRVPLLDFRPSNWEEPFSTFVS